jgi:hypothetical protein
VQWAALSFMLPTVQPQIVVGAETSPAPDALPIASVKVEPTLERAIAVAVASSGVDVADVAVEALITDADPLPAPVVVAPAAPADTTARIESDLTHLEPRFRAKVERVIARARKEYGLQVVVRETIRTQERQDALFAQGRTQPGEIVTWTKKSLHTVGLAADLEIISETPKKTVPAPFYARLATIANEEGLATLGPRDPGHVEFRGGFALPTSVIERRVDPKLVPLGKTAPVAEPAKVVAPKAITPAPVAPVAVPRETIDAPEHEEAPTAPIGRDAMPAMTFTVVDAPSPETPVQAPTIASRIHQVESIADIVAERPVSGVVLRLDNDTGPVERIRIDVRRNVVEASIHTADPALTQRIASETPALHSALERHGLEVGRIELRSPAAVVADAPARGFENNNSRDRDTSSEPYRRSTQQESRQRQRRNNNQHGEPQR